MTEEHKHTAGPWETGQVSWDEETGDVRYTLHGIKVAHVADARLIAAAPELLAALESAVELVGEIVTGKVTQDDFNTGVLAAYRDIFEDAITKAKGGAE
jgi:hypothetical protein